MSGAVLVGAAMQTRLERLRDERDQARHDINSLQETLNVSRIQNASLEEKLDAMRTRKRDLKNERDVATRARENAEEEFRRSQVQVAELLRQRNQQQQDAERAEGDASTRITSMQQQVSNLESEKQSLQAAQLALQRDRDEAVRAREAANKEKDELQRRLTTAAQPAQVPAQHQAEVPGVEAHDSNAEAEATQNYRCLTCQAHRMACKAYEQGLLAHEKLTNSLREQLRKEQDTVRGLRDNLTAVNERSMLQNSHLQLRAESDPFEQRFLHLQKEQSDRVEMQRLLMDYIEDRVSEVAFNAQLEGVRRHMGPLEWRLVSLRRFVSGLSQPSTPT